MTLPGASFTSVPNTFAWWKSLAKTSPEAVARELDARISTRLTRDQQRACLAWLSSREALVKACLSASDSADSESPLRGIPYFLKDLYPLAGAPLRAGSRFDPSLLHSPALDAAIVSKLKLHGALCAGKTQLHEFAYGLTGENEAWGNVDNPRHPGRTTGGSSSGSAAVVAAGLVPFALGTDTGGSVRVPAAFCGLYGFRSTPGDVFVRDAFPLAPSCDTAGWFTTSPTDLQVLTACLCGPFHTRSRLRGLYLNIGDLDTGLAETYTAFASRLAKPADATASSQLLEAFRDLAETYSILTSIEAVQVHHQWLDAYKELYSPSVWQRIDRGRHWTDRQVIRASSNRQFLRDTLASYFLTYDFLILPAAPCPALRHEDCAAFDRNRILNLTAPASLAGLPVLSLPFSLQSGLMSGLQVIVPSVSSAVIPWALAQWESEV